MSEPKRYCIAMLDENACQVIMEALGELPAKKSMKVISDLNHQFSNQKSVIQLVKDSPEVPEPPEEPDTRQLGH